MRANPLENLSYALAGIRQSRREPFAQKANNVMRRFKNHELALGPNDQPLPLRATTVFGLQPIPGGRMGEHIPVVMFEAADVVRIDIPALQADLVRTFAIADQFPVNGYERRLTTVYGEALEEQAKWLTDTNTAPVKLDPRTNDHDRISRQLLGPAKYHLDAGFDDWQKTADEVMSGKLSKPEQMTLKALRDSAEHFIVQRHHQQPLLYTTAVALGAVEKMTPDELRKFFCASMLGGALVSRPPREN